jgi:hypothetical protein
MLDRMGRALNNMLGRTGYRLVSLDHLGWLHRLAAAPLVETDDPVEASYRATGTAFILEAELTRMRGAFFAADAENPFARTLAEYAAGRCSGYAGSPLEAYYTAWQPATVGESLGLGPGRHAGILTEPAAACALRPWGTGYDTAYYTERLTRRELAPVLQRLGLEASRLEGNLYFGPVSGAFGEAVFARLVGVLESIRRHGFNPERHGHMTAGVLVHDGQHRFEIRSGKHRLAALAALGIDRVPVRVCPQVYGSHQPALVRREEVERWPNVRSGIFTTAEALRVFDTIFAGVHPSQRSSSSSCQASG